jgi:hypothetical protein
VIGFGPLMPLWRGRLYADEHLSYNGSEFGRSTRPNSHSEQSR